MRSVKELSGRKDVDVLLINPGAIKQVYQDLANDFTAIESPSLAALFGTYLRKQGATVDIIDAPGLGLSPASVAEVIHNHYNPQLVVMVVYGFQPSASTQNMPAASETCKAIKKLNPDIKIMMTGTHPAALPEQTMREEQVDFVCDREGPDTILLTARALKEGKKLEGIPSLLYRHGNTIVRNQPGELLENLDEAMPSGAWDLLPMQNYRAHNWHCFDHIDQRKPYVSLHTSLGCPFKCSFCCINAPFGKPSYRMWSPQVVAQDIDHLVQNYKIKNIKFVDEMFVLNKDHVLGICDELIARDYDLNIWAYARVDTVKDAFLEKLRKAGFRWLALGIESGSKHVRDGVEKGRFGTEEILKVVRKIQDAGIYVIGNYIFGLPDDNHQSMQETLDLAIEANCEFANFYSAMAYPGSKLYNFANEQKWELPSSWIGYSQHSFETQPLRTEHISASEVLKFRDEAFMKYFTNDKYLDLVNKKFGQGVVDNMKQMTQIKLKRKLYAP